MKLKISALLVCFFVPMYSSANNAEPRIIEQGNDWVRVQQPVSVLSNGNSSPMSELLLINSLEGLNDAPLAGSVKYMLADGFNDAAGLSASNLDENVILIVDTAVADAVAAGTAEQQYQSFLEPDDNAGATTKFLGCDTGWRRRTYDGLTKTFSKSYSNAQSESNVSLNTNLEISGEATAKIGYKFKKTSFCLPWVAALTHAQVLGNVSFDGTSIASDIALQAAVTRKWRDVVAYLFNYGQTFMIGPMPVYVGVTMPWGVGLDLGAQVAANAHLDLPVGGGYWFDYTCRFNDGCSATNEQLGGTGSTLTIGSGQPGDGISWENLDLNAALEAKVQVRPYIFSELQAYLYTPEAASVGLGVELGLPLQVGAVTGTCGDADGVGGSEFVTSSYIDANAEIALYWGYRIFLSEQERHPVNWPISQSIGGFKKYRVDTEVDLVRGDEPFDSYRRHLYFGSYNVVRNAFSPMLSGDKTVAVGQTETYALSTRPCYPFPEASTYKAVMPDGTVHLLTEPTAGDSLRKSENSSVDYRFLDAGRNTIQIEHVGDVLGRDFTNDLTFSERSLGYQIDVDPNTPPVINSGFSVSTSPTSECHNSSCYFKLTWGQIIGDVTHFEFKHTLNGTVLATKSFQPTISSQGVYYFKIDNTASNQNNYYLYMRACNSNGCSGWKMSNQLKFKNPDIIPTLSFVALSCLNEVSSWSNISGAEYYELKRSVTAGGGLTILEYKGASTTQMKNFVDNHYLAVRQCNKIGCSEFSTRKKTVPSCN